MARSPEDELLLEARALMRDLMAGSERIRRAGAEHVRSSERVAANDDGDGNQETGGA